MVVELESRDHPGEVAQFIGSIDVLIQGILVEEIHGHPSRARAITDGNVVYTCTGESYIVSLTVGAVTGAECSAFTADAVAACLIIGNGDSRVIGIQSIGGVSDGEDGSFACSQRSGQGRQTAKSHGSATRDGDVGNTQGTAASIGDGEILVAMATKIDITKVMSFRADHEYGVTSHRRHDKGSLGECACECASGRGSHGIVSGAVTHQLAGTVVSDRLGLEVVTGAVILCVHGTIGIQHQVTAGIGKRSLKLDYDGICTGREV
ncbi:hypothetical protein DSECCO2_621410 [anaerobic digester metagenome]